MVPFVSVLCPTRDRRAFIPNLLRCFRHQAWPADRMELIVLDDGRDSVADLLDGLDPQIHYHRLDVVSPIGTKRNRLCELAQGEILVNLDDDDWSPPDRVARSVALLDERAVDVVGCSELAFYHVETDRIQTFEPHRWLCLQAANTGAAGTATFVAELARERDPRRRLDLLEGLAAPAVEGSRAALLELVQGDTLSPQELVYAAERLVTLGPVARIAPVLKRVTLRVEEPAARRALQALLWRSYPSQKRG